MATEKTTPNKIKELFSSFLSTLVKTGENEQKRKDNDISNGDKKQDTDSQPKPVNKDTPATAEDKLETSDSRNRTEFYKRVSTYSPVTWCAKPLSLSPLVCARFGWQNVDIDMLQCTHCRAFLSGQLPKSVESQTYKDSCNSLKQNLTESHEKLCKWSSSPSPESFTQVPYHNKGELYKDFSNRVVFLVNAEDRLPDVSYSSFTDSTDHGVITREHLDDLVKKISNHLTDMEIECRESVIIYSICGWTYHEPHKDVQELQCNYCCRKIGLWNYSKDTKNLTQSEEPSLKKAKLEKTSFDPIAGHRYWCPWLQVQNKSRSDNFQSSWSPGSSPVKSSSLNSSDLSPVTECSDPAWLHVAKFISKYKHNGTGEEEFFIKLKESPRIEGLRHLRQVLKSCTSPSGSKFPQFNASTGKSPL